MKRRRRGGGRPQGSTVPARYNRQNAAIAVWRAFREFGYGPYESGYLAATVVSTEPIRLEDVEHVLMVASTEIKHATSDLTKRIDGLVKAAERSSGDQWSEMSAQAIKGLILAHRTDDTGMACFMLDTLIYLGWSDFLVRLRARISVALHTNIPPYEGTLGRQGQQLLRDHGQQVLSLLHPATIKKRLRASKR